jgi:hypothetical protein
MRRSIVLAAVVGAFVPCAEASRFAAPPAKAPANVNFVPSFLGSMSLSLRERPFYASELLGAFHSRLAAIETLPDPDSVARSLQAGIEGEGKDRKSMKARAEELGAAAVPAERAAAILMANALTRPDQFQEVVNGLESVKPGLGSKVSATLRDAGGTPGASPGLVRILRQVGSKIAPQITNGVYNAKGELERLFDGR